MTAKEKLPGADVAELGKVRANMGPIAAEHGISTETVAHLVSVYGSRYSEVLGYIKKDKRLRERICETNPDIMAEVAHAIEKESACTLSDFMLRRSLIGFRRCEGLDCCTKVANKMAKNLGWNAKELASQIGAYRDEIAKRHAYEQKQSLKPAPVPPRRRAVARRLRTRSSARRLRRVRRRVGRRPA
jgi:glycerol-3-phosphate dehydrogenase